MSVNQNIYGLSSQWQRYPYDDAWSAVADINECIRVAYFGNYEPRYQTLARGAASGMIDKSVPLDKSLSYCGLGTESAYSHVKYYSNATLEPLANGGAITPFYTDSRTITNFAFMFGDIANGAGYGNSGGRYNTTDPACRYYPDADVENDYNNNRALTPVTSFKFTNFILLIRVKCCRGLDPSNAYYFNPENGADFTLYDYVNTNAHNDYPYVYCVYVVPYCYSSEAAIRTPYPNLQRGQGIAILDSYDGAVDSNLQQPLYSYYYGQTSYSDPAFKIHGMLTGGGTQQSMQYHASAEEAELGYLAICPDTWTAFKYRTYGSYICMGVWREYDNTFREECMTAVACFGCFFTDKISIAQSGDLTDTDMYCGTLVDGVGHGAYTHGADNAEQPQYSATTNDTGYDPNNPPAIDPNNYSGEMSTHDIPLLSTATMRYNISVINMALGLLPKLWDYMALADPNENKTDYSLTHFLTQNPIDCIVSLQFLPVKNMSAGTATTVKLGNFDTQISAYPAKTTIRYDCGNYEIFPRFGNNWIDRETQITLYLPFCGTVSLDPETYMGKTVNVEYLIDLTTGTCSAAVSFIANNGKRVITDVANGVCAIDLPVTGIQQQTLNSQLFNASESTKQLKVNNAFKGFKSIMGAVTSLNGENPMGAVSGLLGAGQDLYNIYASEKIADYNLQHTMLPLKMIGTSGGLTGAMCELYPTIIFSRPTTDYNATAYGHSIGFACCVTNTLGSFSGYAECTNVDLSGFAATETEKNMIQQALAGGVYL